MTIGNDSRPEHVSSTNDWSTGKTRSNELEFKGQSTSFYGSNNVVDNHDGTDSVLEIFLNAFSVILKYKIIIILIILIFMGAGFAYSNIAVPIYQTSSTIQIDKQGTKVLDLEGVQAAGGSDKSFYATQYELLVSRTMAAEVVSKQNLASNLSFLNSKTHSSFKQNLRQIYGSNQLISKLDLIPLETRVSIAVGKVMSGLSVRPVGVSRIVQISYRSTDPKIAALVANAVVDTYITSSLERRFDASSYARKFLEERLTEVRLRLQESEAELVRYGRQASIFNLDSQAKSIASSGLDAERSALFEVKRQRLTQELRWKLASKVDDKGLSLMADAPLISTLRSQRAELIGEYESKLEQFKPGYPDMQRLTRRIAELESRISVEAALVRDSIRNDYLVALEQEKEIERNLVRIKGEVLDFEDKNIQYKILKREVETNTVLYEGLLQRYKEVGVAAGGGDKARVPGGAVSPVFAILMFTFTAIGAFVASGIVLFLHILRDQVDSPSDIEGAISVPALGTIPAAQIASVGIHCAEQPRSALSEAVRSLRTSLQFSTSSGLPKSLLMTSSKSGEGKSSMSAGLGISFSQLGLRVLLIDADLRDPSLSQEIWGAESSLRIGEPGLSNFLSGSVAWEIVMASTKFDGLKFISAGQLPPNPAELLAGPRFSELLLTVQDQFDIVIIDGPPVLQLADAPLMSSMADATLLVFAAGETRRRSAVSAIARLRSANGRIIGFVLNKTKRGGLSYGYGDGYSYGGKNEVYSPGD